MDRPDLELLDLVRALLRYDTLSARQWIADAHRSAWDWSATERPLAASAVELALAAGIVELQCQRDASRPPEWTRSVGPAPTLVVLVRAAERMPRLRRLCETEGPEPLRRRRFLAPPEFLTAA